MEANVGLEFWQIVIVMSHFFELGGNCSAGFRHYIIKIAGMPHFGMWN